MSPELLVVSKIKTLPLHRQNEVLDFIEFLQMKESIEQPDLVLSDRDRDQFLLILDRPPLPSATLKSALLEYQQVYGDA